MYRSFLGLEREVADLNPIQTGICQTDSITDLHPSVPSPPALQPTTRRQLQLQPAQGYLKLLHWPDYLGPVHLQPGSARLQVWKLDP